MAPISGKDLNFAHQIFLAPCILAFLVNIALFALSIVLIMPISQMAGTDKIAIPAIVLAPLILGVMHLLACLFTGLKWKIDRHDKNFNKYLAVALVSYVFFHLYTYVAIGTWAGVMGNGLTCNGLVKMRGSLTAELSAIPDSVRDDFGVVNLMGLDAQTCNMVRWTWGVVIAAAVLHLLTAVAGYALKGHAHTKKSSSSRGSSRRGEPEW